MASSRRTCRRRQQKSLHRHQLRLEGLEKRYALDAASLLDPSSYEPGSLLVKLKDPVVDSLQSQSSGDAVFGISSRSTSTPTVDPLAGLPTSVSDVLAGYGASGFGRVFPSVSGAGQDDTLFGISSLSTRSTTSTSSTSEDTAAWEIGLDRWVRIDLPEDADLEAIMASLEDDSSIAAVEPDFLFRMGGAEATAETTTITSTDDDLVGALVEGGPNGGGPESSAWHLAAVNAQSAWSHLESIGLPAGGASGIVVAVIDTGVDYNHPDLAANMWVNTQEIVGNGIDDDGNGLVDDIHGATFISNTHYHNGDPIDDHSHGTHVAGVIAAANNNGVGGTGVAYNARIMALKALQYSGVGTATDIAEAIYYAVEQGADIINMSFGSYSESGIIKDALEVAFGQCVLIAAAGNDDHHNEAPPILPPPKPMYPADYNWVIGVQATTQTPNEKTGYRAPFSNYDTTPGTRHEYEVAAPGVDVHSTLPNDRYAAWDGTSMATPIVSGIASLLRTKFADKDLYSSRFIMGQLAVGGVQGGEYIDANEIIDASRVLTETPKPELKYLDHWVFDTETQAAGNDSDGRVDAGETIDLAIALKNRWGKADNVQVTLDAYAAGASGPDPYVTINTGTVNYGAVGSFNEDDNGLTYDEGGLITGVNSPFTFTVSPDTPNDHVIPFRLTITAENGIGYPDGVVYEFEERFTLMVQRGRELPLVITEDMTLTKDDLWIVGGPVLVPEGVTLRVDPGTHIQWGTTQPRDPYAVQRLAYIKVQGTMLVQGSFQEPVHLYPSEFYREENSGRLFKTNTRIFNSGGIVTIDFARINAPEIDNATIKRSDIFGDNGAQHLSLKPDNGTYAGDDHKKGYKINRNKLEESRLRLTDHMFYFYFEGFYEPLETVLVEKLTPKGNDGWDFSLKDTVKNTVFFGAGVPRNSHLGLRVYGGSSDYDTALGIDVFSSNAILNPYYNPDVSDWLNFRSVSQSSSFYHNVVGNYWGTTNPDLIDIVITDNDDDFNLGSVIHEPHLTTPSEQTYPFVVNVDTSVEGTGSTERVGPEPVTFTVTFNRDMDQTTQPQVSFGPDTPLTDYTVHPIDGGWQDARTWVGTFNVTPLTGDGYQLIRVSGARAADKPWLVTGDDKGRFRFEVITSGAEAMNLQASGGEGQVDLSWVQDDFELLAGYNIYRSTSADGTYTRVNQTLIPAEVKDFVDTSVQPAVNYFYKFRVAKTDGTESGDSNIASAAPLDTIPPQISHTPVATAAPNFDFSLRADVTDNLAVESVTLNHRAIGDAEFSQVAMINTTGNRYTVTLDSTVMSAPGIEYFIAATDGVTTVYNGDWQQVRIEITPLLMHPQSPQSHRPQAQLLVVRASRLLVATSRLGRQSRLVVHPQPSVVIVNSNQITATTPARFAATADVVVTNPDAAEGALLNGFTFVSDGVVVSMPSSVANIGDTIELPISLSDVAGMLSAEITITFDNTVLAAQSVRTGALANGWALEANTATPGQVVITAASATSVSATGVLAYVTFNVVGDALASTPLTISSVSLNDGAISTETAHGTFAVNDVFSIGGTVRYFTDSLLISGATLSLENTATAITTTSTSSDGTFAFDGLRRDGYVLSASKEDEVNGISAFDASLVLRSAAGLVSLTTNQQLAADVNRNGSVSALDASYILQKSVGLIADRFPGAGKYWDFVPAERTYADLTSDRVGQDFTAVLIGDVSGNWGSLGAQGESSISSTASTQTITPNSTATLSLETIDILPGTSLPLPLVLSRGAEEIYSLDALIEYDPSSVSITQSDVTAGTSDGSMFVVANIIEPGRLRLAVASSQPLPDQQAIASLTFTVNTLADVTPITVKTASLDEGRVAATSVEGGFAALTPIENDGQVRLSRNRNGLFYANNKRLKFRGQPVQAQLAAWSLLGAETVEGKNIAFVRHASGAQHRWSLDSEWSFEDPFTAISNATTLQLPANAREVTTTFNVVAASGAYVINGVNNPTLTVRRGQTYTFNLNTGIHRFWLQTTGSGYQSANVYDSEFTGNSQTTGEHQWVVPEDAPDEIFYQCEFHPVMFGKIIVVD